MFLLVLVPILISVHIIKKHECLNTMYYMLRCAITNDKLFVSIISCIYGVLPIPGRIAVATGLYDTCTCNSKDKSKLGILAYITTHHYYLWSPLEKSVLLILASTGISYAGFMAIMWPYLLLMLAMTFIYVFYIMKEIKLIEHEKPANINTLDPLVLLTGLVISCSSPEAIYAVFPCMALYFVIKYKEYSAYASIDWKLVFMVSMLIVVTSFIKSHADVLINTVTSTNYNIHLALLMSFLLSFLLGSSSKFAAVTSVMVTIFGLQYLPLFYIYDYCGYLLSPAHKCVLIGKSYFQTNYVAFYQVVGIITLMMILFTTINNIML